MICTVIPNAESQRYAEFAENLLDREATPNLYSGLREVSEGHAGLDRRCMRRSTLPIAILKV